MSPGLQVRDFIEVRQVADQLVTALRFTDVVAGQPRVRHVATAHPQRLVDFAQHCWQQWGARGQLQPGVIPMRANEMMRVVSDDASLVT